MYLFCLSIIECQKRIMKQDLLKNFIYISLLTSILSGCVFSTFSFFIYHCTIVNLLTLFVYFDLK